MCRKQRSSSCPRWDFDHEGGRVVASRVRQRLGDEAFSRSLARAFEGGMADDLLELTVPKAINKSIRTKQKTIPGPVADGANLRLHELVASSERLLQGVAARMSARFTLI